MIPIYRKCNTNGASIINNTYVLPSFNIKYNFSENSIFRVAGVNPIHYLNSKRTAPFKYQDVSFSSQGNPI